MSRTGQLRCAVALTFACAATGCDSDPSAQDHVIVTSGGDGGLVPNSRAGAQGDPLDDNQIVSVALTINTAEIEQHALAVSRAQSTRVMAIAQQLVSQHRAAQDRENALLARSTLMPEDNVTSEMLRETSARTVERLQTAIGPGFDRVYVGSQVNGYRMLLELIDGSLLPSSRSAAMSYELRTVREELAAHLAEVEESLSGIEGQGDVL